MGLFNRKKKVEEEGLDTRDVLASSLNTTPKATPATNTVAEGSGLAAVIDLMRAKVEGQVTLNLTQTGNDMSYKLYQRGSEIESGDILPGGEWFKPVADLYIEEENGPRGTWNRALIVVNPAIGGDDAVQVSFMNTETSSSHNLNYGLAGAAAVAGAATGFAAASVGGAFTASEGTGAGSNEADEAASAASAKHRLDSVSARFADDKKADQTPAEENAVADASVAATAPSEALGLYDRASDSETTETVEEAEAPAPQAEENEAAPAPQIVGTVPAYTQRTSQNAAHAPATEQEDVVAAPEGEEGPAADVADEVSDTQDATAARSAYTAPRFAHRAESTPVDQTQTEETQPDAEGATADETATAAEETVELAETVEYAEPAETVEAEDSATVVVDSDAEFEESAETDAQAEDAAPATETVETAETVEAKDLADQDSADHQPTAEAEAETDSVSSESASLAPAISHDGLSTSPAQLPDHLDDEEFLETDEAAPAPASTAYAAPAVVPGNMDAPMAGSGVDVAPSYSQQTLTKPSDNRKADGNLVLSEVEVVSRFAPAYDALFGANGTALDVSTVLIRVRTLGSYYDALTHVRRNGFWEQVRTFDLIPEDVLAILQLKADSYKEGYGSPLAMNIRFTPGIPVSVAFDYADEEAFVRYPEHLPAQQYVEELRMFPRTGANIPAHMNEALASWTF